MADPQVRSLGHDEIDVAADVLARAFWDDPLQVLFHPNERSRYHRMFLMFRMELRVMRSKGPILTTDDLSGVAVWNEPERWRSKPSDLLTALVPSIRAFGGRLPAALDTFRRLDKAHPRPPHWYLATIGTDPNRTGKGAGSALIRSITDRCDRDGIAAFLESSKPQNVPYYRRFGFEVTDELELPSGHVLHLMWRDPQDVLW